MSFFFMGSTDDYEQEQQQERKARGEDISSEETKTKKSSHKLIPPVSDEIKLILKRTIVPDLTYVHVKSDIDQYDKFYHTTGSESLNKELYENARKIKRLYKNYPEYLWAVKVYEEYIYAIIDKYGSSEAVRVRLAHDMIDDWLPPNPVYSSAAPDYDLAKKGIITVSTFEDQDQEVDEEFIVEMIEELKISEEEADEIEVIADVETDRYVLSQYKSYATSKSSNSSSVSGGRVNISDLAKLQTMFKQNITGQSNIIEDTSSSHYLSKEPDKIREEFYTSKPFKLSQDEYEKLINGETNEEEDLNKMVKDPITRKYMTLGEYRARDTIRVMGNNGWNDIKILERFGVGSEREIEALKKKRNNKKKNKKLVDDTVASMLGGTNIEIMTTNSTEDMKNFLFGDD